MDLIENLGVDKIVVTFIEAVAESDIFLDFSFCRLYGLDRYRHIFNR